MIQGFMGEIDLETLERIRRGKREIAEMKGLLEILRGQADGMRSVEVATIGSKKAPGDPVGRTVAQIADLESELNARRQTHLRDCAALIERIVRIPTSEREVLVLYYLEGFSDAQISERTHFSRSSVRRIRVSGVNLVITMG